MENNIKAVCISEIKLRIKTLTNICVKSHLEALSPLSDYVCLNNLIHFIDNDKFFGCLIEKDILDKYVQLIESVSPNAENKHKSFLSFIQNNNLSIEAFTSHSQNFTITGNLTEIGRHISLTNNCYIPGSTLKGAIIKAVSSYLYSNKELVSKANKRNKKYASKNSIKEFSSLVSKYSLWGIRDTDFINSKNTSVIQLNRKRLVYKHEEKDLSGMSVLQQSINKNSILHTSLFFKADKLSKSFINKSPFKGLHMQSLEFIFKCLNIETKKYIEYQLKFMNHIDSNIYKIQLEKYLNLTNQFLENNKKALLCIGFGKSQFQNTMGAFLIDSNNIKESTTVFAESVTDCSIGWCILEENTISDNKTSKNIDFEKIKEGDVVKLDIVRIQLKPKRIYVDSIQYGEKVEIEVVGVKDLSPYEIGDSIPIILSSRNQKTNIFKTARIEQ